jgi:1-acyl-sn-glycerol-3-phosphate acyltransferase
MGAIFVNPKRGRSALKAIDMGLKFVGGITSVLIFPEGQRTPDGQIHKFKRGFIYILKQSSLDLLPVTLNGFYRMKPMKRFYFDPDTKPEIIIHKSISNSRVREMSEKDLLEETTNIIGRFYRP